MSERQRFSGTIYKVGMNYAVDVPAEASRALGGERHVNVAGEVAGTPFRSRLTPRGEGAYRLFLNGEVRSAAGVASGDPIEVEIWRDDASREVELPVDLANALEEVPGGLQTFEEMTEAQRTGMLAFVERARTAETRARYVQRVVDEVRKRVTG